MRRTRLAVLVVVAVLCSMLGASSAFAQDPAATFHAVDDPTTQWEPTSATVTVGDTVEWRHDSPRNTTVHNVQSTSSNWDFTTPYKNPGAAPDEYTFTEPGLYTFVCQAHPGVMTGSVTVEDEEEPPADELENVLVLWEVAGFPHDSRDEGVTALEEIGADNDFSVDATEDSTGFFTDASLAGYDAVVFLSTTADVLDADEQAAFERYIQAGGGYVGIHAASDTEYTWPWYGEMLGGYFRNHPPGTPQANVEIEDATHPSTEGLPATWTRTDEWYNFQSPTDPVVGGNQPGIPDYSPRTSGVHVLATVDESTYDEQDDSADADDHPIAWCSEFDGGKVFYTGGGHTAASFDEPEFRAHLLGGLEWTSGAVAGDCGEPRQATPGTNDFEITELDDDTESPMKLDIANDGRVFYTERVTGEINVWNPESGGVTTAAQIPVSSVQENGMLGIVLDPAFDTNGHLFVTYTPPTPNDQIRLSRFTVEGNSIDPATEQVIFTWEAQREQCCHTSGALAFGLDGDLYIATGDNTNPFGEPANGFAPIDERPGRGFWDAQRTSANTNNLMGKILRIRPLPGATGTPGLDTTYTIPTGNLFTGDEGGGGLTRPEIYAMGFRNPFTMRVDPTTGWLLVGDYGPDAGATDPERGPQGSVEFNVVKEPGNFGWPYCVRENTPYRDFDYETLESGPAFDCAAPVNESPNNTGLTELPASVPATMWMGYSETDPRVPGLGTGGAPTSGPRYDFDPDLESETKFPEIFDGDWFIGNWNEGWIKTATLDDDGDAVSVQESPFMDFFDRPHDMKFGPDGSLYVIDWDTNFGGPGPAGPNSGLYKIDYVKGARRPIAQANATPDSGPVPLEVEFSSEGSLDPEGTSLTYHWDFDDGTTSTDANPTHSFDTAGTYNVLLTVTDQSGATGTDTVQVSAGNTRPVVEVVIPEDGQFAAFGDLVPYEIQVTDAEDETINCDNVTLDVSLGHDTHAHNLQQVQGCSGTVEAGVIGGHGGTQDLFTVLDARYVDEGGPGGAAPLAATDQAVLHPKRKRAEHFTTTGRAPGGATGGDEGVQTEATADAEGGNNIGFIEHGDYISYQRMNLEELTAMRFRVASAGMGGTIQVRLDAPDGPIALETPVIAATGGWQNWTTVEVPMPTPPEGTHELFFVFNNPAAGDQSLMNMNWFQVVGRGAAVSAAPEVSAAADPDQGEAPLEVQFTGTATDPDAAEGDELTYAWDFGVSGTTDDTSTEQNPTYTYERAGTYTARFTATDPQGASSTATVEVQVTTPDGECPTNNVRSDEFEGNSLDTNRWTVIRPDAEHPFTVENGSLNLPVAPGSIYQAGTTAENIIVQPLPSGETSVTAKITTEPLTQDYQQAGLRVYADDDNWASLHMISAGGNRDMEFIYENAGSPRNGAADKLGGIGTDAPLTYWVRINSDGSELTAEYSFDGEEFLPVGQPADISSWNAPQIGPAALSDQAAEVPMASFDWVRFDPDSTGGGGGGGGGSETELFADQFDGTALGSTWEVVRPNQVLSVSDGALRIPAEQGDVYEGTNTANNLVMRDLPESGEWVATAKLNFEGDAQYHQAGIMVRGDDDNLIKLGRIAHSTTGDEKFEFIHEDAGAADNAAEDSTGNIAADFPDDFWVRLSYDGENVTGEYSTDGSDWTTVGRPWPLPADAQVGLFSFSNQATTAPVAAFDSFRLVEPGSGEPSGPSFDDQFDGSALDTERWNAIVRDNPAAYEVGGGELTVTTELGDIYTADTNPPPPNFILQDAAHAGEDWTIETKLSGTITDGYSQGGLMAHVDGDNYVKYDAISDVGNQRINRLELRSEITGAIQQPEQNVDVPEGTTDIWLRLTKTGDSYTGEYSFDGETWAAAPIPVTNPMASPDFGLFAFGPQASGVGDTVSFDYFLLDGQDPGGGDPCECVTGPGQGDEFDGSSLDAARWDAIAHDDPTKYAVADGGLTVTTTAGEIYQDSTGGGPLLLQSAGSLGEDYVLETTLSHALDGGYSQGGIMAYGSDDDYVKIDAISDQDNATVNRLELRSETGSEIGTSGTDPTVPAGTETIGLRLTKAGNTYSGEYSFDGGPWTPFGYTVTNAMTGADVGLYTQGVQQAGDTVTFDYFAVNGERGCPGEEPENAPPVIESATATPSAGIAPLEVQFDVEATDADEDELTYGWDFDGDGTEDSTEEDPTHTYTEGGDYEAEVTVSDGTDERTRTVMVNVLGETDPEARFRVLVFSKTAGFRHSSIGPGHAAIEQLGEDNGFQVDHTEDATLFNDDVLELYDSVIWLSTTGDVLDEDQQAAFERYITAGGGYTGIHAAADTEYDWKWYGNLVGAYFKSHPPGTPAASVDVEDLDDHSTQGLPERWDRVDEWYNYRAVNFEETGSVDYSPRGDVHVLASVDETTYDEQDENATDDDHPISWCQRYDGGRSWYTGMGHTDESFTEENYLSHILGGIEVSAGVAESEECGEQTGGPGAPTVEGFGNPTSGRAPLQVRFSATGLDPEGGRITYRWEFGDGDRSFSRNARHTYTTPGTYTATVTATDRDGNEGTDTVEIIVGGNEPPTVTATADPESGTAPLDVRFGATGTDPDGRANRITYEWDFGDEGTSFARNPRHTYMEPGTYTATVTATDEDGGEASDSIEIVVEDPPGNMAPTVEAAANPDSGAAPLNVRFTSQASDPDGDRLTYAWDFDDGSDPATTRNARHTYTEAGTYDATVTVTDEDGATGTATVQVEVTGNQAPTVQAAADPRSGTAPLRVRFSSSARDADGDRLSMVWDFGNGVKAGGPRATYTYTTPGVYDATVTVTDPDGATGTATVQVTVAAAAAARGQGSPPPAAPQPDAAPDQGDVAGESAASFRVALGSSAKVKRVLRRGLRYRVRCGEACKVSSVMRLSGRRLGKAKARTVRAGASRTIVLRLDRKVRRQLVRAMRKADVRRVKVTVVTKIRTAAGTESVRDRVTLKR